MSSSTVSQDNDSGCHSLAILPQHVLTSPGIARKFSGLLPGQIEKHIWWEYFTEQRKDNNSIPYCRETNPTTPLSSALRFSALTMREIRLVIAALDPGHEGEALLNRIRMQGQHDFE